MDRYKGPIRLGQPFPNEPKVYKIVYVCVCVWGGGGGGPFFSFYFCKKEASKNGS